MAKSKAAAEQATPVQSDLPVSDPHRVPVVYVDMVGSAGFHHGVGNMTLVTARHTPNPDGSDNPDLAVVARLRFGLEAAKAMRERLDSLIKLMSPPKGQTGH